MKKNKKLLIAFFSFGVVSIAVIACSSDTIDEEIADDADVGDTVTELHAAFTEFDTDRVEVTISDDGTKYIVTATGQPNHVTEYYPEDHELHIDEPDVDHTGEAIGDPTYIEVDYEVTIEVDATPDLTGATVATSLGEIGVAVSGSYIYNNYEGMDVLTEQTAQTLDWAGAHIGGGGPQGTGPYHYHLEPTPFSSDDSNLIGILLDGVFIYGRKCASTEDYPTDLDSSGGHTSTTQHSTDAEYHYHMINEQFFTGTETYIIFEGPYMGY